MEDERGAVATGSDVLIRGVVRGADGAPLEGAVVAFAEAPVDVPDIAAVTGDDGSFVVSTPAPGRYRLGLRADGHIYREIELDVSDDVEIDVIIMPVTPCAGEATR